MKAILFICIVYAYVYAIQATEHSPFTIEEILKSKCDNNAGNTQAYYKLDEGMAVATHCSLPNDLPDPLLHHEEFCRALLESDVYECASNFTEVLRPCLDETESYFPDFILTMLNTTYNELCGANGFSNIEYLYKIFEDIDPETNKCLKTTGNIFMSEETLFNSTVYINFRDNSIINLNAKDVCSDLKSIQKYLSLLMKQECNEDYSRFVDLYSQPFLAECNIIHN